MISAKQFGSRELYSPEAGEIRGRPEQEASWQVALELGAEGTPASSIVGIPLSGEHVPLYESLSLGWSQ